MVELVLIHGGERRHIDLAEGEHLIGRSPQADLVVPVPTVSRRHAMLRVKGAQLWVRDLGSAHGTEVDGATVGDDEVEVPNTSVMRIANVRFHRGGSRTDIKAALLDDADLTPVDTYVPRQDLSESARTRIVDMLSGLFELVSSPTPGPLLEEEACRFVSRVVDADRVVIMEDDGPGTPLQVNAFWSSGGDDQEDYRLSRTLIDQVLEAGQSIVVEDALHDPRYDQHESVLNLRIRSAIVAPLFDNERVRGILYVDTLTTKARYTREDLQVLTAIANAVAVRKRNSELEQELGFAARIQENMLPKRLPRLANCELDARLEMCRGVGGDLYQCIERPTGSLLIAVGDVAGKGMPAALYMAATTVLLRLLARFGGEPEDILYEIHDQLRSIFREGQFVTMFVGDLDLETGRLLYSSAGHDPAYLLRADGGLTELNSTGLPVGLIERIKLGQEEVVVRSGDLLAVYSDGIPEATPDGEIFLGHEAFLRALTENRDRALEDVSEAVMETIETFLQQRGTSDDITLVLVRAGEFG